ncbi:MAG: dihydroorotase [Planctomycetaceae bacterium]|nr:dihydroorotase [Planctomycetaceae bacterium]
MTSLLIRGGRLIDPSQDLDRTGDLLIRDGKIAGAGDVAGHVDEEIDAEGMIVVPGLIDLHAALRDPGDEEDETTFTGTAAALAGGFTSIACLPDTTPAIDNRAAAEFAILQAARARNCHVYPLGAVTKNLNGEELAEMGQLVDGGAVGFSDGKNPIHNAEIMRRALEYSRMFDRPIFNFPEVEELSRSGIMHEGYYSTLLGLRGMPAAAESIMVSRDLALAEMTEGRLHVTTVTVSNSVQQILQAKEAGVKVTCSVTPHHLALDDSTLQRFDAAFKVNPPLRSQDHIDSLIRGLKDGTIDAISSDHQPYSVEKKRNELDEAPFGIAGLETVIPICIQTLIDPGHLSWLQLIDKLSTRPARILGLSKGTLRENSTADVTLIDPDAEWTIEPEQFYSRGRNTPFAGWTVKGRAETVLVNGQVRFHQGQLLSRANPVA